MSLPRFLQYLFIAIIVTTVGFSLYQWNASRASTKLSMSQSSNLTSGLVGYWTFDGADTIWTSSSTGTTLDKSGSGNTGTLTGMTQSTNIKAGKIGQGIYMDGVTDHVQAGMLPDLSAAGSISVWFKGNSFTISNETIVSTANWDTGFYGFNLTGRSNEGLTWQLGNASTYQNVVPVSGGGFSSNIWYHVVLTWDGSNVVTYINGAKINTTAQTVSPVTDFYALRIGENAAGASRRFNGVIDELRIYNRAVSAGEVTALYQMSGVKENTSALEPQGVGNLNSALASYWKFDDGSGATTVDSSVNATYTGTLQGNTSWTTGQINGALSFDGTGDYVTASPVSTALPVTMCAWFKLGTTGTFNIVSLGDNTINNYIDLRVTSTRLSTYLKAGGVSTNKDSSTVASMVGSWHHGCGVYTASTIQVYLDGNANLVPVSHALVPTGIIETKIGRLSGSTAYDFNGDLDEVRIYNRALSADEISKLYQTTTPTGVDTSLKGYWSLDGNATNWTSSTTGTALDLSGANNTGTLSNMNQSVNSVSGKLGQGIFSTRSSTQRVLLGTNEKPVLTNDYSIAFWVYPTKATTDNTDTPFVSNYNGYGGVAITITDNGFFLQFFGEPGDTGIAASELSPNRWYFITGTRDSVTGVMNLYKDGVLAVTGTKSTGPLPSNLNGQWSFGQPNNTGFGANSNGCGCKLDEIRMYDRVLSASEVANLYQTGVKKINTTQDINTNGLVGHWTLDGKNTVWSSSSAGTTLDTSGGSNTGTITNMSRSTSVASGKIGQALDFAGGGSADYVNFNSAASLDDIETQGGGGMTVMAWINPRSSGGSGNSVIIGKSNGGTAGYWRLYNTGRLAFAKDFSTTDLATMSNASNTLTYNQWQHVAATWDGSALASNVHLYINGAEISGYTSQVDGVGTAVSDAANNVFMSASGTNEFDGKIDDARIYNRVLSTAEITALYTAGR
jgi:hypothetical protein